MARLNVSIPIPTLVKALKARLASFEKENDAYGKAEKKYREDHAAWAKKVLAQAKKDGIEENISVNTSYNKAHPYTVTVTYRAKSDGLPPEPRRPSDPNSYTRKDAVGEIGNAIRLLELSDDTHVGASTYKTIAQYL